MMGLDMWSGASTLGLDGILFLTDIGLAAGAKMEVMFEEEGKILEN